jgi:hypothetical protein
LLVWEPVAGLDLMLPSITTSRAHWPDERAVTPPECFRIEPTAHLEELAIALRAERDDVDLLCDEGERSRGKSLELLHRDGEAIAVET